MPPVSADADSTPPRFRAHLALISSQFAFGTFPLFGKWAFGAFGPGVVAGWRLVFGSVVFLGLAAIFHRGAIWPRRGDFAALAVCAVLGVGLNQALYLEGLKRSSAVNTGLMMMLVPLFTFGIAILVRQEKFSWKRGSGIGLALIGTAYLVLQDGIDLSSKYLVGNLLLVGNTLCYSLFLVGSKPLMKRYQPLVFTTWMYVLSLWFIPIVALEGSWVPADAEPRAWWSLLMVLLFPTAIAYLLNLYALQTVRASTTAVYVFSQPLIAGAAGVAFLGESLDPGTLLAGVCILTGLWIVISPRRSRSGAGESA